MFYVAVYSDEHGWELSDQFYFESQARNAAQWLLDMPDQAFKSENVKILKEI